MRFGVAKKFLLDEEIVAGDASPCHACEFGDVT